MSASRTAQGIPKLHGQFLLDAATRQDQRAQFLKIEHNTGFQLPASRLHPHNEASNLFDPGFSKGRKVPFLVAMTEDYAHDKRRYPRISLPKGMWAAWYGGEKHQVSRVRTLGMGGAFISAPDPPPVGTQLRLAFEVPTGYVQAEAIVRSIQPGEGMGIEFTRIGYKERLLLKQLLKRLMS